MRLHKVFKIENTEMQRYPKNTYTLPDNFKFWKFKIIVEDEETKRELQEAFKYIHNLHELDTEYVIVNQLVHQYQEYNNIEIENL